MFPNGIAKVQHFFYAANFSVKNYLFFQKFYDKCYLCQVSPRIFPASGIEKSTAMDIDLLSKMLKELIPDHDRVSLPGLGCFITEVVPSAFSDRGYTINPPYRRLSFRTGNPSEDSFLAELYASSNGVDTKVAEKIISDFTSEMKKILIVKKTVVFPGLGRLRATRENNFFFVADEDLDIYPEGFGLEPVSLKSHQETREEVSAVISGLQSIMQDGAAGKDEVSGAEEASAVDEGPAVDGQSHPESAEAPVEGSLAEGSTEDGTEDGIEDGNEGSAEEREEDGAEDQKEDQKEDQDGVSEDVQEEIHDDVRDEVGKGDRKRSPWKTLLIVVGCIIGLTVLLLAAYLLAAHFCPDFIDSLLYDSEQLDVLRYGQR